MPDTDPGDSKHDNVADEVRPVGFVVGSVGEAFFEPLPDQDLDADDVDHAEDMADIRAAEAARVEMAATGEAPIPWDEVKADLGL